MTREEAKQAIAEHCGLTILHRFNGRAYCEFENFIFMLNLLGSLSGRKQAGFYFYSYASLQDDSVVSPWLREKLTQFGISLDDSRVRTNRSPTAEGHAADIYIPFPWDNPTDDDYARIQSLCKRLHDFQTTVWEGMTETERNKEINQYNTEHLAEVRDYINRRRKEMPTDGEDDEPEEVPQDQGRVEELFKSNFNVILTGAPGTGKTYTAKAVACAMTGDDPKAAKQPHIQSVQFHPGYDYSDFVVGMKPVLISAETCKEVFRDENGIPFTTDTGKKDGARTPFSGKTEVSFRWEDGIFKKFADKAKADPDNDYVFLIDEINRADLSRVFGELFSLLEEEYRYPNDKGTGIMLPNGEHFVIPRNLYILGTMNDIDRSVESMDFALRRRFAWYEVTAKQSEDIIRKKVSDTTIVNRLLKAMQNLNAVIGGDKKLKLENGTETDLRLGTAYQLGGAIFAKFEKCNGDFDALWNNHISNVLGEYLRGRRDRDAILKALRRIFDDATKGGNGEKSSEKTPDATNAPTNQQAVPQA